MQDGGFVGLLVFAAGRQSKVFGSTVDARHTLTAGHLSATIAVTDFKRPGHFLNSECHRTTEATAVYSHERIVIRISPHLPAERRQENLDIVQRSANLPLS